MATNLPKRYSMRFRQRVVERMQLENNISQLSRELGLDRSMMYIWKRKLEGRAYGNVRTSKVDVRDRQIQELQVFYRLADQTYTTMMEGIHHFPDLVKLPFG